MDSKPLVVFLLACLSLSGISPRQTRASSTTLQDSPQSHAGTVQLPVLVLDHAGRPVTDLKEGELRVIEAKQECSLESLSLTPEAPAEIGILIDKSNSIAAFKNALRGSDSITIGNLERPEDRIFVATFTNQHDLICPPTSESGQIKSALYSAFFGSPPGGVTSVYDTIFWASSGELFAGSGHRALVVISDMEDNTSSHYRDEAVARARQHQISIFPVVPSGISARAAAIAESFASATAGVAFTVNKPDDLAPIWRILRADIDNTYLVSYRPQSTGPTNIRVRCTRKGVKIIAPNRRL